MNLRSKIKIWSQMRAIICKKKRKKVLHKWGKYYILGEQRVKEVGSIAKLVRLQTATLSSSVRVRLEPPTAQVAKLVDAQDLKSCGP